MVPGWYPEIAGNYIGIIYIYTHTYTYIYMDFDAPKYDNNRFRTTPHFVQKPASILSMVAVWWLFTQMKKNESIQFAFQGPKGLQMGRSENGEPQNPTVYHQFPC